MEYIIEDEFEIELDIVTKPKPTADVELELPVIAIEERKPIYRGKMLNDGATMVNGKAPSGSSEDDPVWTVAWNYLDILGDITNKVTETNKIWSEV